MSARASGSSITPSRLVRKKTVFAQNADQQWAFRPPPEIVVKQLSKFFPHVNLDTEVIKAVSTSSSDTNATPAAVASTSAAAASTKLRYRSSIRRVAEERQRILEKAPSSGMLLRNGSLASVPEPETEMGGKVSIVRKRSTKMWGSKVEEVKPGQLKAQIPVAVLEVAEEDSNSQPGGFFSFLPVSLLLPSFGREARSLTFTAPFLYVQLRSSG